MGVRWAGRPGRRDTRPREALEVLHERLRLLRTGSQDTSVTLI